MPGAGNCIFSQPVFQLFTPASQRCLLVDIVHVHRTLIGGLRKIAHHSPDPATRSATDIGHLGIKILPNHDYRTRQDTGASVTHHPNRTAVNNKFAAIRLVAVGIADAAPAKIFGRTLFTQLHANTLFFLSLAMMIDLPNRLMSPHATLPHS